MVVRVPVLTSLLVIGSAIGIAAAEGGGAITASLQDAKCTKRVGEAVLELTADQSLRYDLFRLYNPPRLVLDLFGVDAPLPPTTSGEDPTSFLVGIRHSTWTEPACGRVVRYVMQTASAPDYGVIVDGGALRVSLTPSSPQASPGPTPAGLAYEATSDTRQSLDLAPSIGRLDPSYSVAAAVLSSPRTDPDGGGAPMNLDVQGADIRTVFRSIAEFGRVNVVPDRDISGPISVRLTQTPWRRALDLVCESAGLIASSGPDVIRVSTRRSMVEEDLEREATARRREELLPLVTEIFQVRYANAAEMKQSLSFVLSKRGSIEVDERTNSILVTDIEDRVAQVRGMVSSLDTETLQVEIVAKLIDVDASMSRQLGITWGFENMSANDGDFTAGATHQTPVVGATTNFRFGLIRDWSDIDASIQALERANKANIISNPSITTVNNRKARILVGKEVPLIVLDQAGNAVTELKKVGITLEVTPYINSESRVTMDIHPEVSDLSSQATVQGGIVFTTTEADTRVMVNDGETAVIGGLIRTNETHFEQGIPVLRSIPLLGHLFKSTDVRKDSRELLIFITPRIVRGVAAAEEK